MTETLVAVSPPPRDPMEQPSAQELRATLQRHGLQAEFKPLWGRTPFNNWLVIARRAPQG